MNPPVHCLIASSKGGVGKSTTALGLGIAFARAGRRVLLVDCDVASRSLVFFTGAADKVLFHLGDLILDRCKASKVLLKPYQSLPGLTLCPSPSRADETEICARYPGGFPEAVFDGCKKLLVGTAETPYDVVLWDTGSGYEIPRAIAPLCTTALVCAEQSPASIRAAANTAAMLQDVRRVRLVICSFDLTAAKRQERAGMLEMIDRSGLQCAGVVPLDPGMMLAQENGLMPPRGSPAMQAYTNLAYRLDGWDVPLFEGIRGVKARNAL